MSAQLLAILFFLAVSLLFYVLFAGADFGAGILELFLGRKHRDEQKRIISHAMAPVWEANHVWLILAVVILFVGFPRVYTLVSTNLHLPLMAILVGIVARGTAFTFRHYDTFGKEYHPAYSRVFALSSLWTSFFLGVTAGAMMLGRISPTAPDFATAYVSPWLNSFSISLGVFTCSLFAFLAAVFLVGEAKTEELRTVFRKRAKTGNLAILLAGAAVFVCAELDGFHLFKDFFSKSASVACFAVASLLWLPFWKALKSKHISVALRLTAAAIVAFVMLGWFAVRFPVALPMLDANNAQTALTFQTAAAPEATLKALLGALIVGTLLIFPALAYLLKVFKWETVE